MPLIKKVQLDLAPHELGALNAAMALTLHLLKDHTEEVEGCERLKFTLELFNKHVRHVDVKTLGKRICDLYEAVIPEDFFDAEDLIFDE